MVPALLLGDLGRMPFVGHFRCRSAAGRVWLCASGRLAGSTGPVEAWAPARRVEAAVVGIRIDERGSRTTCLRSAWEAVLGIAPAELGPDEGAAMTILLVAGDESGVSVTGVGLGAVWGQSSDGSLAPLVDAPHPLLSAQGRPAVVPGALDLDLRPVAVVGAPAHLGATAPVGSEVPARCGVRDVLGGGR